MNARRPFSHPPPNKARATGNEVMVVKSVNNLVDLLKDSPFLKPCESRRLVEEVAPTFDDPLMLARQLIRQGWLTLYQARKILAGHARDLVIGPYLVLEKLGEGGMGRVYKAIHQELQRIVALKVVRTKLLADRLVLRRFQREAQAAAKLAHPNIVRLYDADQTDGQHFLALEFVKGVDLTRVIKDNGPLPVYQACDYIRQAALGLQHAHDAGLIHRDIKPGNLLVSVPTESNDCVPIGGVVKILDMGLARPQLTNIEESGTSLTQDGTVVGTPDFMAPEQAKNSRKVDGRADLYSLGCTFFYLLTGKAPFADSKRPLEKLIQHQTSLPPSIHTIRRDVPYAVSQILERLLAKIPDERFPHGNAVVEALTPFSIPGSTESTSKPSSASISYQLKQATKAKDRYSLDVTTVTPYRGEPDSPFAFDTQTLRTAPSAEIRRPSNPLPLMAVVLVVAILVAIAVFVGLGPDQNDSRVEPTPPDESIAQDIPRNQAALARPIDTSLLALPHDIAGVMVVYPEKLARSAVVQELLPEPRLDQLQTYLEWEWGMDPLRDVQSVVVGLPESTQAHEMVVVAQGRFDQARFRRWLNRFDETPLVPRSENSSPRFNGEVLLHKIPVDGDRENPLFAGVVNGQWLVLSPSRPRAREVIARLIQPGVKGSPEQDWIKILKTLDSNAIAWLALNEDFALNQLGGSLGTNGIRAVQARATMDRALRVHLEVTGTDRPALGVFLLKYQGVLAGLVGILSTDPRAADLAWLRDLINSGQFQDNPDPRESTARVDYQVPTADVVQGIRAILDRWE